MVGGGSKGAENIVIAVGLRIMDDGRKVKEGRWREGGRGREVEGGRERKVG